MKKQQMIDRLDALMKQEHVTYLETGAVLKWLNGHCTRQEFARVLDRFGLSYRRSRYYILVWEVSERLGILREDSVQLGWTKFSAIAGILTPENKDYWIERARQLTVIELKALVQKHRGVSTGNIQVQFIVNADQESRLHEALIMAGAIETPQGLIRKAEALAVIIDDWLSN